jgi:peptidyl-prolyl cis-trans isomerase C
MCLCQWNRLNNYIFYVINDESYYHHGDSDMTKSYTHFLSALSALMVLGVSSVASADSVVLKIDGKDIKSSEVETIWNGMFPEGQAPQFSEMKENTRTNVLRGVVSEHLINKEAMVSGIEKSPEVQKQLNELKTKIVAQAFLEKKADEFATEPRLKEAYAKLADELKGQEEVHARHILVSDEAKPKELVKKLNDGGNFEALAKELSKDKASGAAGGDLGYFTEDRMVPAFSKAAFALKKGEISSPVQTGFGWHVIKVEDRRPVAAPAYDEVKEDLEAQVKGEAIQNYINDLIDTSDVTYFDSTGAEKEFTRTPDSTVK